MALKLSNQENDIMETCLDAVEVDAKGSFHNIGHSTPATDGSAEARLGDISLDTEGNLRFRISEPLLNAGKREGAKPAEDKEFETIEKRLHECSQSFKKQYSKEGTSKEKQTENHEKINQLDFRRRSFVPEGEVEATEFVNPLATESADPHRTDGMSNGATPDIDEHNLHDIELDVFSKDTGNDSEGAADRRTSTSVDPRVMEDLEMGDPEEHDSGKKKTRISRLFELIQGFFSNMSSTRIAIVVAVVAAIVGVALILGLVPASVVYIEYYELALAKNRVTGRVNRETTYYPGCYLLTPDTDLIRFNGTAHTIHKELNVFTSDGLTFTLGLSLQYFIKPQELGKLFTKYEFQYEAVVDRVLDSTIKNTAAQLSMDTYRLNRTLVEREMLKAITYKLSGDCCPSCCPERCDASINCRTCGKLPGRCYEGYHIEVRYFQMLAIDVPSSLSERFLRQTILVVESEKEFFLQEHAVETKLSQKLKKEILNNATEIRESANAQANVIRATAAALYERDVQLAYIQALKRLYQRMNITNQDHKLSLMYVRALEDAADNLYSLNYGKLTVFGNV